MLFWRDRANLWTLITPPTVWAIHFMVCYGIAAVECAKSGMQSDLFVTRVAISVATVVALALIGMSGLFGYRHWGVGSELPPYDAPTSEQREQFLGVCILLVSCLSFVGVVFVALPPVFITDCR